MTHLMDKDKAVYHNPHGNKHIAVNHNLHGNNH